MNRKNKLVSVVIVTRNRKKDLIECINSYIKSSYKSLEIIVVDNASRQPLIFWLPEKFPIVKLISCERNIGAAAGRNRGIEASEGELILFSDDDAYADKDMVTHLVSVFEKNTMVGIVQPLVYDRQQKNLLQGAGHDINLFTGRVRAWGVKEKDVGQYEGLREVPMCGCVWMVKREVIKKIGNFDEEYFIPYEDCDFSYRARKEGYKLYCLSLAKTYHRGHKNTFIHPWIEWLGITTSERAYRVIRNKMIFMRKHSTMPRNLIFYFLMLPLYIILHSLVIVIAGKLDILLKYWHGFFSGVFYSLSYPMRKQAGTFYKKIDENFRPLKFIIVAWTDPVLWVINQSSKSVLDLACGQGLQMEIIKMRMKINYAVGVDLFEPYIKEARKRKTHDKYILEDIRKVQFPNKSFDIVLALHVLEHMGKQEAWKVLDNMEKWATNQVIVASPIGEHYHPIADGNIYQFHLSAFTPEDFEKRGYKIKKYGWKWLLGHERLIDATTSDFLKKIIYTFNLMLTPIYFIFQNSCDYTFVAFKNLDKKI